MKAFLMHRDIDFDMAAALPSNELDLVQDLELDTLLAAMAGGNRFLYGVAKLALLTPLSDPDAIRYRQDVLTDCLEHPVIVRGLYDLGLEALEGERRQWGFGPQFPESLLSRSLTVVEFFVTKLRELRAFADEHRSEFRSEGFERFCTMLQDELSDDYFELVQTQLDSLAFKNGVLISAQLGQGNKGIDYVLRLTPEPSWRERLAPWRRPAQSFDIHPRDQSSVSALSQLKGRGITRAANALAQSADHIKSFFNMLVTELAFYMGCLNLREYLESLEATICLPDPTDPGAPRLSTRELYEISLALQLNCKIVGNDISADGKSLVIITGANQGGKSTFLRSLGLAQLMMQAGMFVAAESFTADVRDGLFTHYKREEDASMLLCNESFAATNEREGSEIARQVISALTESGVKVVFVTHLFEFADSVHRQDRDDVLFLRAPRGEDGQRTFKLVEAAPLPTSYGEDTYKEIFGVR